MHWFSILNSLMVVLVMSSIVAMIMMRTIRRDLQRYEGLLGDAGNSFNLYSRAKIVFVKYNAHAVSSVYLLSCSLHSCKRSHATELPEL